VLLLTYFLLVVVVDFLFVPDLNVLLSVVCFGEVVGHVIRTYLLAGGQLVEVACRSSFTVFIKRRVKSTNYQIYSQSRKLTLQFFSTCFCLQHGRYAIGVLHLFVVLHDLTIDMNVERLNQSLNTIQLLFVLFYDFF